MSSAVPLQLFHHGAVQVEELPTRVSAAQRLVAIGDLHGDLTKAKRAFQLAGLTDDHDNWVGGKTVCVQVKHGVVW